MGLIADEHPAIAYLLDTAGKVHGKGMQSYLTMMAVRLLEMRRVLKNTGSIYLHCDPTASHYLKQIMDAVFGPTNYRSEIVWKRTTAHSDSRQGSRRFGRVHDLLLYFSKESNFTFNQQYQPYEQEYIDRYYKYLDEDGRRYWRDNLTAAKPGGDTRYEWKGKIPPPGRYWAYSKANMERMEAEGRIVYSSSGTPMFKRYLDQMPGLSVQDIWSDIRPLGGLGSKRQERLGYPTQKPLALLERIIMASSNEGDVVLDPFCGCATACVAADKLGRQWVGIDISPKAVELVNERLRAPTPLGIGPMFHNRYVTVRTDIPRRTDIDAPIPYRQNKHVLYGQQEGQCGGCKLDFPFKVMEVDHVVPRSRGGSDHMDNLQLLCGHCNRTKGDRPQEYLMARLSEIGV